MLRHVSRETSDRLAELKNMLIKWNQTLNLVSPASIAQFDARHVDDSAQIVQYAGQQTHHWLDLGSGGGLPGLVVAAILAESDPGCRITLVEADKRKCVFLREAARTMNIAIDVLAERIENIPAMGADVVSARALAPLKTLCFFAQRHLRNDGTALFLKGANHQAEVRAAQESGWRFDLSTHQSTTDPKGVILELRGIHNVKK